MANSASFTTQRRALLIAVPFLPDAPDWPRLVGPNQDVQHMQELLCSSEFKYLPENITILGEDGEFPANKENMQNAMDDLVEGAKAGDYLFFQYAGHGCQVPCDDKSSETDRLNEVLLPCDARSSQDGIIDNEVYDRLVSRLPVGCNLVAVIDACHSGTAMDLGHYKCYSVPLPWMTPEYDARQTEIHRRSDDSARSNPESDESSEGRRLRPRRKRAMDPMHASGNQAPPYLGNLMFCRKVSLDRIITRAFSLDGDTNITVTEDIISLSKKSMSVDLKKNRAITRSSSGNVASSLSSPFAPQALTTVPEYLRESNTFFQFRERCTSPESLCPGSRPQSVQRSPGGHVTAWSAAKDNQNAYEDFGGRSLSAAFIDVLRRNPRPTYWKLLTDISHIIYQSTREMNEALALKAIAEDVSSNGSQAGTKFHDLAQCPQLSTSHKQDLREIFMM